MLKIKVQRNKFELDADCQKRMNTSAKFQYESYISGRAPDIIKGCPLGRSFGSAKLADKDLIYRILLESHITVKIENILL